MSKRIMRKSLINEGVENRERLEQGSERKTVSPKYVSRWTDVKQVVGRFLSTAFSRARENYALFFASRRNKIQLTFSWPRDSFGAQFQRPSNG
jgi:hypothetical protein